MNFKLHTLSLAAVAASAIAFSVSARESVVWESLGNRPGPSFTQRFTVNADEPFDALAFCIFKAPMKPLCPLDTVIEILPGYYEVKSPRFHTAAPGSPLVVELATEGAILHAAQLPDGIHLAADGKARPVDFTVTPPLAAPSQWQLPGADAYDPMPYGPEAFAINDSLRSALRPAPYAMIPTPKSISLSGTSVPMPASISVTKVTDPRHDYYRAEILPNGSVTLATNSGHPTVIEAMLSRRLTESAAAQGRIPVGVIEDWADFAYRGFMLDVARNFIGVDHVKSVLDIMARYGLNTLHFHLGDDEGWRVEIPSLPELTAVGSRRGYTETDAVPFLKGIYRGNGDPTDLSTTANGFFSQDEFIDILRYADALGIAVIPEFDTPGHSRAAIRAMEHRYHTTGDSSLRLIHDGDTSVYSTAQFFGDNIMNPALEGPYRFWTIVFDDLIATYRKAGVELKAVNIGGDEVAEHAWDGSAPARELMDSMGYTRQNQLHAHFVRRVAELAAARGLKISGWQEIALNHSDDYNQAVRPVVYSVNCWTNAGDNGSRIASLGYPLVLSNVDYLYFDHIHTPHPEDPGMSWGGIVSEFSPLHATVDRLCPADSAVQASVAGISAHLFSETVNGMPMVERYILPRILGLAERAHNGAPTLTDAEYFGAITAEMPRWAAQGRHFYLRQPGIRITPNGLVEMNEPYGLGQIRYTLDGTDPTPESPLYTAPFPLPANAQIRARLYYGPTHSPISLLPL